MRILRNIVLFCFTTGYLFTCAVEATESIVMTNPFKMFQVIKQPTKESFVVSGSDLGDMPDHLDRLLRMFLKEDSTEREFHTKKQNIQMEVPWHDIIVNLLLQGSFSSLYGLFGSFIDKEIVDRINEEHVDLINEIIEKKKNKKSNQDGWGELKKTFGIGADISESAQKLINDIFSVLQGKRDAILPMLRKDMFIGLMIVLALSNIDGDPNTTNIIALDKKGYIPSESIYMRCTILTLKKFNIDDLAYYIEHRDENRIFTSKDVNFVGYEEWRQVQDVVCLKVSLRLLKPIFTNREGVHTVKTFDDRVKHYAHLLSTRYNAGFQYEINADVKVLSKMLDNSSNLDGYVFAHIVELCMLIYKNPALLDKMDNPKIHFELLKKAFSVPAQNVDSSEYDSEALNYLRGYREHSTTVSKNFLAEFSNLLLKEKDNNRSLFSVFRIAHKKAHDKEYSIV